ncbi:MAG: hypothetical protein K2U26_10500, partial [Cyclobacteriaceae bacterium]|nr:hypothetical protein [Cyclobacteriaceae bacterium]
MKTTVPLLLLFLLVSTHTWGQAKLRKLAANINHPAINNYAPFVSFDGNSMVYIADVAEDNALTMNFTVKDGVNWRDPVILPRSINTRLNFMKGFALSTDGKTLYITNARNNGLGGFDIYSSQLTGTQWSEPVNLGLPINSKGQEGCPSLSMDGNTMYFMRCEKMDFTKADNCKLMMATRRNTGVWN